ncbi:hypothetical protein ACNFJ7_12115 [Sphingomonas sp. HT-1]|uniref:hypothetical protein n=1 Tax=unclassified Sphingomonas TaxID=196159 RepID=UPI0002F371F8|nr:MULTISPECIES: hypothetical protein [unclassified Sphingomonas]KTF68155.1 hypothetical protein ATB93_01450 [Sphingomonas sp. WG]
MLILALLLAPIAVPQAAPAQATTACKATDASLPAALAGWSMPGDELVADKAVSLDTVDGATLKGLPAGAKPGRAAMIEFRVANAGTYGIALDQPGWLDVLPGASGGKALPSVAHGYGPDCSTIRKIVRFRLSPGSYRVFASGLAQPKAKLMLVAGAAQ